MSETIRGSGRCGKGVRCAMLALVMHDTEQLAPSRRGAGLEKVITLKGQTTYHGRWTEITRSAFRSCGWKHSSQTGPLRCSR